MPKNVNLLRKENVLGESIQRKLSQVLRDLYAFGATINDEILVPVPVPASERPNRAIRKGSV